MASFIDYPNEFVLFPTSEEVTKLKLELWLHQQTQHPAASMVGAFKMRWPGELPVFKNPTELPVSSIRGSETAQGIFKLAREERGISSASYRRAEDAPATLELVIFNFAL